MSEYGVGALNEHEKQKNTAVALVRRVNDVLLEHPRTLSLDIRDLQRPGTGELDARQGELIRMSANNHVNCLAAFYKRQNPTATSMSVEEGVHSALPLYDSMTGNNVMLLATTLLLPGDCSLQAITVTVRDEYVLTGSTIYVEENGAFEAMNDMKARDDGLIAEALDLVGVGRRDLVLPLLSGAVPVFEIAGCLEALRPVVAERYGDAETERFLQALEHRYHEKRRAEETAKEFGLSDMSASEMEDLLAQLEPANDWR